MIYNNYINSLNSKVNIEQFKSNIDTPKLPSLVTLANKSKIIYTNILGEIIFIKDDKLYSYKDKRLIPSDIKSLLKLNKNLVITGGFYDHLSNSLFIFDNKKVFVYCFKLKKIISKTTMSDYFGVNEPFNGTLLFKNLILFFTNSDILIFDKTKNKLVEDQEISKLFKNLPKNFSICFNNFLDLQNKIPIPTPTFLKDGKIFTLDIKKNKIKGPRNIELGFFINTSSMLVSKTKLNFKLNHSGHYRIYLFGAGMPSGGFGGMLFNDFYIKKSQELSIIGGKMGRRIPVKSEHDNNLSKVYDISLPYNGSSSGSGGTFLFIDKELKMVAGGGGGWSSEQVIAPSICDSKQIMLKSNNYTIASDVKRFLPIKKFIISSQQTNKDNIRYKIVVKKLTIEVFNLDYLEYEVNEYPKQIEKHSKYLYETSYSEMGSESTIEISFANPISDYRIQLDYDILATDTIEFINNKVIIIDEQYRKYVLHNFNLLYNFKYITGENVLSFVKKNSFDPKINNQLIESNEFVSNGYNFNATNNIKELVDHDNLFYKYDYNPNEGDNSRIGLKGGEGGGAHSLANRQKNNIICGGGGGYNGGYSMISLEENAIDYAAGSGGTSYINSINFNNEWHKYLDSLFINNFNNEHGYAIIQKIEKRIDENEFKNENEKKNETNNVDDNNVDANNNNFKFFNNKAETFLSKNKHLMNINSNLRTNFSNSLGHNQNIEFKEESLKSIKQLVFLKTACKEPHFNNMYYGIKSDVPFSLIIMGWNDRTYERTIISPKEEYLPNLNDDISHLNHGFSKINKKKMNNYLETLINNNIYKHSNKLNNNNVNNLINDKDVVYNLFSLRDYYQLSENKQINLNSDNINMTDGNLKLNDDYNYLYFILKFDNDKKDKDKNIRLISTKFNSINEDPLDIKERTKIYL